LPARRAARGDAGRTQAAALYEREGPQVFDRSLIKQITSLGGLIDERYDARGLLACLRRHLGDTCLAQATTGC
jgi:hypothetical protein